MGFTYALLSPWPVNKQNKPKTPVETKGLDAVVANAGKEPFYGTEELGGHSYFTAVYADVAVADACVDCHNSHPESPRTDFKLNDVMGGVVANSHGRVISSLDNLPAVLPAAEALGKKHVGYGVKPEHYQTVASALLSTLATRLGPAFTPEVKSAWVTAYGALAGVMIGAGKASVPARSRSDERVGELAAYCAAQAHVRAARSAL